MVFKLLSIKKLCQDWLFYPSCGEVEMVTPVRSSLSGCFMVILLMSLKTLNWRLSSTIAIKQY